ncbi:MAG: hypothetical protein PHV11_03615 [Candidatus Bipolaricaulis sp.]|nr:hypothetical protein [Candidatus Bipolaricaulis sp.]MDD5219636.1 hypothetical protein [Candidatus Bipolaricaulis sp.]
MTRPPLPIDHESGRLFFGLVLFCGIALVLSVPGARVVRELGSTQQIVRTLGLDMTWVFLDAYVLAMGLLGLSLGSADAERREQASRRIGRLALRVLLGQLFCLPYLVFSCALFPGREGGLALVVLLATVTALVCAVQNGRIERAGDSPTRSLSGYAILLAVSLVPLVRMPLLSPIGAARLLVDGASPLQALAAFFAPTALLAALCVVAARLRGEAHAV